MSAADPPPDQLSADELRTNFGSPLELEDQLEAQLASAPVEPASPSVLRVPPALWAVLLVIAAGIVFQAWVLLRLERPAEAEPKESAAVTDAPADELSVVEEEVRALVRSAQQKLSRGLYEDVVSILEPATAHLSQLAPATDLQISMFLSRAYLELGDLEAHRRFRDRATAHVSDPDLDRRLQAARRMVDDGRFDDARRELHELLCLADLSEQHAGILPDLRVQIAQSYLVEGRRRGGRVLPGLDTDPWKDAGEEWR